MAHYASGVKIDNILNIIHNGSGTLKDLQAQHLSESLSIDAEENFSIAHCEEHPSRRRLVEAELDVFNA